MKEKLRNSVAAAFMAQKLEVRDSQHAKDTKDLRVQTSKLQEEVDRLQRREKELLAARRSDMTEAERAHKQNLAQASREWAAELEKLKAQCQ